MPGKSQKVKFLNIFNEICVNDLIMINLFGENDDRAKEKEEEIFDNWTLTLTLAECSRYFSPFVHNSVPNNRFFVNNVLSILDETRFQQIAGLNRTTFNYVLNLIKDDEVFEGARSNKQHPIETQLLIALYRLGSSGESATFTKMATLFGVGDGGTIQTITNRVLKAIVKHLRRYIVWSNASERQQIVSETKHELPYCIGYVDGTEVKLAEKPSQDPESYFSRKHIYSIKIQCVCDCNLFIRHLVVGFPGSVHDARIYNTCDLAIKPYEYFNENEWIAGDSAYKLTKTVITPFRANTSIDTQARRNAFNREFSRYRIRIEHCYGILKERLSSLKELRLQLKDDNSVRKACEWILACAILHNITIEQKDEYAVSLLENNCGNIEELEKSSIAATNEGEQKRRAIMELMGI